MSQGLRCVEVNDLAVCSKTYLGVCRSEYLEDIFASKNFSSRLGSLDFKD